MPLVYKDDPEFEKKIDPIVSNAMVELDRVLSDMFGSVVMRSLSQWDWERLRTLFEGVAYTSAREMEFTYIDKEHKRVQESSANMMRAIFAGLEIGDAAAVGREPDPNVLNVVRQQEEKS